MKTIAMARLATVLMTGLAVFGATGCEDKEAQAEIERLNQEADMLQQDFVTQKQVAADAKTKVSALQKQLTDTKLAARAMEGKLKVAERELARYKSREEQAKMAKEREPSRREKQAAAKTAASGHLAAIVTIKGDNSSGKGVVVESGEKVYVYFAPSMLLENSKFEVIQAGGGALEKFGAFEIAPDADLARIEIQGEVEAKLTVGEVGAMANGTPLLGVKDDGTLSEGRSYGLEATLIVGDSRFASSALGAPVFHGQTGDLIGVMVAGKAAVRELWPRPEGARMPGKRDVSRLDREVKWNTVDIGKFLEESKVIGDIDRLTRVVHAFAAVPPRTGGLSFSGSAGGRVSVKELLEQNKVLSPVRELYAFDEWLKKDGARASASDMKRKVDGVYGGMARVSKRHTASMASKKFSAYNAKVLAQSLEWRKEAEEKLDDLIKAQE